MSDLAGFRLVTLCGSAGSKHDAMRDTQDIIEPMFTGRGIEVCPVDLGDWSAGAVPRLVREVKRQRPDAILTQYPTGAFGHALGPILVSLCQRVAPSMVMLHEFTAAHIARKAAVGALLLRADRIGVTAEREQVAVQKSFPWLRGRFRTVPIASNIPSRVWTPGPPPTVVHFGQIRPNKGIEEFLAVHPLVKADCPQAEFEIIGATLPKLADYAAWLEGEAARRGITLRFNLDLEAVADRLAAATAALLPYPDGASMRRGSLFAAAACGTPIVTTVGDDTPPSLTELVEPNRTLEDLARATIAVLTDERARDLAQRRSLQLARSVGWEATVDAYCTVFRELARLRRP